MSNIEKTFRIYCVHCLSDPASGDYCYLVMSTGGGLNFFRKETAPPIVHRFLIEHNSQDFCLLLNWPNYVVFSEPIPHDSLGNAVGCGSSNSK